MLHADSTVGDVSVRVPILGRILVGIDGTEPSLEACRQAASLLEPEGALKLATAVNVGEAALAGPGAPQAAAELEQEAAQTLDQAREIVGPRAESSLLQGPAERCLANEIERWEATLLALGTHAHSRASEIMLGGTAGTMLHRASCSVLIARRPPTGGLFPNTIVAGMDGSSESRLVLDVARAFAARFSASMRVVAALGGKGVDADRLQADAPEANLVDGKPVEVLVAASSDVDLLIVGSRGLHGLSALGSVSERVAHRAKSSVLVVRPPQSS